MRRGRNRAASQTLAGVHHRRTAMGIQRQVPRGLRPQLRLRGRFAGGADIPDLEQDRGQGAGENPDVQKERLGLT